MSLLALFVVLIVIGLFLYCVNRWMPQYPAILTIINVVGVIVALLIVLSAFGILDSLRGIQVPRL